MIKRESISFSFHWIRQHWYFLMAQQMIFFSSKNELKRRKLFNAAFRLQSLLLLLFLFSFPLKLTTSVWLFEHWKMLKFFGSTLLFVEFVLRRKEKQKNIPRWLRLCGIRATTAIIEIKRKARKQNEKIRRRRKSVVWQRATN